MKTIERMYLKHKGLFLCCLMISCLLIGCSSGGTDEEQKKTKKNYTDVCDSYMEREISLPENMSVILDTYKEENGKLCVVGTDESHNQSGIWEMSSDGESWELLDRFSDKLEGMLVLSARISSDGQMFLEAAEGDEEDAEHMIYRYDVKNRKMEEMKALMKLVDEKKLVSLESVTEDNVLAGDYAGQAYVISLNDNDITALLSGSEQMYSYECIDSVVYILTADGVKAFDVEKMEQINSNEKYNSFITAVKNENIVGHGGGYSLGGGNNGIGFSIDKNGEEISYASAEGIFVSDMTENKKIIDGSRTTFTKEFITLQEMVEMDADTFIVTFGTSNGNCLYCYEKRDEGTEIEKTLTVFTLYENKYLSQACAAFQQKYPTYKVNIEVGIVGDSITVSEAVKALNVKIAGGDTPDVFVMDGLNVERFVQKDLLENIKGVVDEEDSEEKLFQNMKNAYADKNKIYAVPARFSEMIYALNAKKTFSNVDDIVNYITELAKENSEKTITDAWNYGQFLSILYHYSIDDIVAGEKADTDKLAKLYEEFQKIYKLNDMSEVAEQETKKMKNDQLIPYASTGVDLVALGENQIALDYATCFIGLAINKTAGDNYGTVADTLMTDNRSYVIPETVLAVSKVGTQKKDAKKLLKFLLSDTAQSEDTLNGFPNNKTTYRKGLEELQKEEYLLEGRETSENKMFTPYTEKEIQQKMEQVEKINHIANMDILLKQIVMEQADEVLEENLSIEEAAREVGSKLELYLGE